MKMSRPVLAHEVLSVTGGMVVAQDRLGARIGAEVLQRGGNAVDAAVTTAFAMGVLQPLMNGVGGGGLLVARFASGERGSVDFGMRAAAAARPDMYGLEDGTDRPEAGGLRFSRGYAWPVVKDRANLHGHAAIAVPGTAAGLAAALDRWGTMSLDQALLPAIRLARDGFPVGHHFVLALVSGREVMTRYPATRQTYFPDGHPLPVGAMLVQSEHARTLELIARHGPDGLYRGEVAERIACEMAAHGGTIRQADLAGYRPFVHDTVVEAGYRGYGVLAVPGPNGGTAVAEVLNILEHFDLARHGWGSVEALHLVIEAIRRAAVDRYSYLGDHADAPFDILPEPGYAATRARTISLDGAGPAAAGDPWAWRGVQRPPNLPAPAGVSADGGTTHISVVDADRNAVGLTQTNMSWSGVIVPGVGVMMNNAMTWFYPGAGHRELDRSRRPRAEQHDAADPGPRRPAARRARRVRGPPHLVGVGAGVREPRRIQHGAAAGGAGAAAARGVGSGAAGRTLRQRRACGPGEARTRGHGGDPVLRSLTLRGAERDTGGRRRAAQRGLPGRQADACRGIPRRFPGGLGRRARRRHAVAPVRAGTFTAWPGCRSPCGWGPRPPLHGQGRRRSSRRRP